MKIREMWKRPSLEEMYLTLWGAQGAFDILVTVILIAYVR